ncbi:MAG TPA: hypothetical protein PKY38_09195 [Opitutaceae bacterium]|nr:hypothetical protein [Opitutaceae bacterium]
MSDDLAQLRADLLHAQGELHEAHAAFLAYDQRGAIIRLEVAVAILTDLRAKLPAVAAAGYGKATP